MAATDDHPLRKKLAGRTALVTGAGRRIGRAIALALAAEEVNVVVHCHNSQAEAGELAARLKEQGARSWVLRADLENQAECQGLIARARKLAGSLDILVNNASIFQPSSLEDVDFAHLARQMQVNAWAPFVLSREFAGLTDGGDIINLLDARLAGYDWTHVGYILSKHVLALLTSMTAVEFAPRIRVNAVAPGLILPPPGQPQSYLDQLINTVPLKRHGEAADVAQAVLFLLKNDFVTGEIVNVDGGRHLRGGRAWTTS